MCDIERLVKMWVKDLVKLMLLLQLFILSSSLRSSALQVNNNGASGLVDIDNESLPNIWEDESVNRMVREMLARDLFREHDHRRVRRQYKREIHSSVASSEMTSATVAARAVTKTTRRASVTQKTKKPSKVTQAGNKNKNRVTTTTKGTKATVKPSTKPIVTTTTAATTFGSVNASSKIKVRISFPSLLFQCVV